MTLNVYEQLMLELVNRARLNPSAEAKRYGVSLGSISSQSKQALAPNAKLENAAEKHANWMLSTDTFSHTGSGGSSGGQRISKEGYSWTAWGENISWRGTTGSVDREDMIYDHHEGLFKSSGHRANILKDSFEEIGISQEVGSFKGYNTSMVTQNFGAGANGAFLTGVVIDDKDNDNFYDIGEGLGGVKITASGNGVTKSTTTYAAGGYSLDLDPGTYKVTYSGSALGGTVTETVTIGSKNVKLDVEQDDVGTSSTPTTSTTTLTSSTKTTTTTTTSTTSTSSTSGKNYYGTSSSEKIYGDADANLIRGYAGNDIIYGQGGRDTLEGGDGNDRIYGKNGGDLIKGGNHRDALYGNWGEDRLYGDAGNDHLDGGALADVLSGGSGIDRASYGSAKSGVRADLQNAGRNTGDAAGDTYSSIENLMGSRYGDDLSGNSGRNFIWGGAGNDKITSRAGNDIMMGQAGADQFIFHKGDDVDRIKDFTRGTDTLVLDRDLVGSRTASKVISDFAEMDDRGVILDFGADSIQLLGVDTLAFANDIAFI